ncbi:hypothetical protein GBA52_019579 [Prunus armeniaca]|nr:hypothetical protein GBA52_019579 [Prunus armeniaca]
MMKRFKAPLPLTFHYSQPSLPSTLLPKFKNQQCSNDYISSLCRQKLYKEALQAFEFLEGNTNFQIFPSTYADLGFPNLVMTKNLWVISKRCSVRVLTSQTSLYLEVLSVRVAAFFNQNMESRCMGCA